MALIVILLVVQIWLLSATLETYLAGHTSAVVPAALFSGLLFSGCLALNRSSIASTKGRSSRERRWWSAG